jgi:riboflavin kinase / FMN adenylyltransferase
VAERVFSSIADVPPAASVVTIGAFDGVHRGHQHILGLARERAVDLDARFLVVTFEPLPGQVFAPDRFPGRIVTAERRRALLFQQGADAILELPFSTGFAKVTAEEFMEQLAAIGPVRELWIGDDFALGYRRLGTASRLREIGQPLGIAVHAVPRVDLGGEALSSTAARRLIGEGRADAAATILGHRFQVEGVVEHGAHLGRQIGFPTANVAPPVGLVALPDGIYASVAVVPDRDTAHPAMTYIGTRPALNTGQRLIETHLFDFDGDLYGASLVTEFVRHLRPDANFASVEDLVAQLRRDEEMARAALADMMRKPVPTGDSR